MPTRIELTIDRDMSIEEIQKAQEVFRALIVTGAIFGVRGGSASIHFDTDCVFQGVQLNYWPWKRRELKEKTQRDLARQGIIRPVDKHS